jgi:hypothetical protein
MTTHPQRHRQLRPQLEPLEPLALLSAGSGLVTGIAHGTFFAHRSNAASGIIYNLFASGRLGPIGPTLVAGGFQTRGFTAGGAGGGNMVFAPFVRPGNELLRLTELSGPTDQTPGEYLFAYQTVNGQGAGTSGTLDVTLVPATTNVQGRPVTNPGFFGNATLSFT